MPYIRVNCLTGALTPPKKAKLAAALVEIVMGQEIEPMTEIGRAATPVMFSEIDAHNWFPGGQPLVEHPEKVFFIVEAVVAASFFSQPRRDALQTEVAKAFVDILGDDGTVLEREGVEDFASLPHAAAYRAYRDPGRQLGRCRPNGRHRVDR